MNESLNLIGLIKAASDEDIDWSAPDASYSSPYLISGMRLTPQQFEAYENRRRVYGGANAKKWLKKNYGKTGRLQKVDESKYPTSTWDSSPNVSAPAKPSRAALSSNARIHRTRVGGNKQVVKPRASRSARNSANSRLSSSSASDFMDVTHMSDRDVMDWVQNHALEIDNAWHSDPYYKNMARRVAAISDPKLFDDARHPVYGVPDDVLDLRVQNLFREAAKPYANMLQVRSYDPVSSGGFGYATRGR